MILLGAAAVAISIQRRRRQSQRLREQIRSKLAKTGVKENSSQVTTLQLIPVLSLLSNNCYISARAVCFRC